jgi:hypothetical protein
MNTLFSSAQDFWFFVQQMLLSNSRLEHWYLIGLLFIVLVITSEQLIQPRRKLRNRSDRAAWGRR